MNSEESILKQFQINRDNCIKCYKCTKVCALGLISVNRKTGYPKFRENIEKQCMDCGQCSAVCNGSLTPRATQTNLEKIHQEVHADGVLKINDRTATSLSSLNVDKKCINPDITNCFPTKNDFNKLIKYRRSVRNYKGEEVPNDILIEIVNSVNWQPTACNQQTHEWIIISSREKTRKLAELVVEWFRICEQAPAIVDAWDKGNECIFRGAPSVIICHAPTDSVLPAYDTAIATTAIDLALPVYGLGSCWAGLFMLASLNSKISKDIYEFLEIPEGNRIYTGLMVGYPKFKYNYIPNRKKQKIRLLST